MRRETIRFHEWQTAAVEDLVDDGAYPNRSEVYRQALREFLMRQGEPVDGPRPIIADGGER